MATNAHHTTAKEATMTPTTVGKFSLLADGSISGPAEFMRSRDYADWSAALATGGSPSLRIALDNGYSPSPEIAVLVNLHTVYAGWVGMRNFNLSRGLAS